MSFSYEEFLATKLKTVQKSGFKINDSLLSKTLKPHQEYTVKFLCDIGKGGGFLDTGLGKSLVMLNVADAIVKTENKPFLILTPLAVAYQMKKESEKFGFEAQIIRSSKEINGNKIYICNYEMLKNLNPDDFVGVSLDESSILKNFAGATKQFIVKAFKNTKYKFSFSATPSPNDYVEFGNQAEFLNVSTQKEMLANWFVNDLGNTGDWRLKKHAEDDFFLWLASWGVYVSKPSDLGFDDTGYILPPLNEKYHEVKTDDLPPTDGSLFRMVELSASNLHREKRLTAQRRCEKVKELLPDDFCLIWCDTNYEADILKELIPSAYEIRGDDKPEKKEELLIGFGNGEFKHLITKSSIAGMGLNYQHCNNTIFTGLNYSYESYYQSIRRFWRFGQTREVTAHIIGADSETATFQTITEKKDAHQKLKDKMSQTISSSQNRREINCNLGNEIVRVPNWLKQNTTKKD